MTVDPELDRRGPQPTTVFAPEGEHGGVVVQW